jgi:large subunit ribosomal protein L25
MEEIFLDAQLREETGRAKANDLRQQGFTPAVIYGEGAKSQAIKVSTHQLIQLLHQHRLENAVINLKLKEDKKDKPRSCLIKEIQYHAVHGHIVHVDFNQISLTKAIKVNIPVTAKGEPLGVKQEGGSLEHILWEVEVECLPREIPQEFEVDVSALKIGDSLHVKDLAVPANVKIITDPEAVVLSVAAPIKEEVVVEAVEGEVPQEPEVIKEKKEVPVEATEEEEGKEKEKK